MLDEMNDGVGSCIATSALNTCIFQPPGAFIEQLILDHEYSGLELIPAFSLCAESISA